MKEPKEKNLAAYQLGKKSAERFNTLTVEEKSEYFKNVRAGKSPKFDKRK